MKVIGIAKVRINSKIRAKELEMKEMYFPRKWKEQINFMESLILAQDERWRRA